MLQFFIVYKIVYFDIQSKPYVIHNKKRPWYFQECLYTRPRFSYFIIRLYYEFRLSHHHTKNGSNHLVVAAAQIILACCGLPTSGFSQLIRLDFPIMIYVFTIKRTILLMRDHRGVYQLFLELIQKNLYQNLVSFSRCSQVPPQQHLYQTMLFHLSNLI